MTALLSPREWAAPAAIHHVLDGLAGFHASEAAARAVLSTLRVEHGVEPHQLVLLGPADGGRIRFALKARGWNRRLQAQGRVPDMAMWVAAGLGAVTAAVLAALLLGLVQLLSLEMQVVTVLLSALTGALVGAAAAATLLRQQPQFKKFDRAIRRKLEAGQWVLVVHGVPWARQAGVVSLVSRHSQNWSAVSAEQGRL